MNPEINAEIQLLKNEIEKLKYLSLVLIELSNDEMKIIPIVVHSFRHYKKNNPLKYGQIIKLINENIKYYNLDIIITHDRLMNIVRYILCSGISPIMANENGIYMMQSKEEIIDRIMELSKLKDKLEDNIKYLNKIL